MSEAEIAAYAAGTLRLGMSTVNKFVDMMADLRAHVMKTLEASATEVASRRGLAHARLMTTHGILMSNLADDGSINYDIFTEVK